MKVRTMFQGRFDQGLYTCLGLDIDPDKLPTHLLSEDFEQKMKNMFTFATQVIDATAAHVAAFKPNLAFYLQHGPDGLAVLDEIVSYCIQHHVDIPVILDGKFGDIGATSRAYASYAFRHLEADSVTLNPYLGEDALRPFFEGNPDFQSYNFILSKTSNPGADEFQLSGDPNCEDMFQHVAQNVFQNWTYGGRCGFVAGATKPEYLKRVRRVIGNDPIILIPGYGKQGGDLEQSVLNGRGKIGTANILINVGSSTLHMSAGENFAEEIAADVVRINSEITSILEAA